MAVRGWLRQKVRLLRQSLSDGADTFTTSNNVHVHVVDMLYVVVHVYGPTYAHANTPGAHSMYDAEPPPTLFRLCAHRPYNAQIERCGSDPHARSSPWMRATTQCRGHLEFSIHGFEVRSLFP